tara:strand:+ start:149 stop:352 length:204 start_codon:yes stop_codon:yes gene_type:complete
MANKLTQEDKWALMTMIGVKWDESDKLSESDAKFLLERANEIQDQVKQQQKQQQSTGNVNLRPPNYT